ncbi:porin family protein [Tenacibaculum maritimum]|uniref:porin family protein n=1 Tax=Tenacibaculum maritimum TaxID=107401 RepID=UPI0012E49221|nr:porin family protein [Tenacibaculum maritimum]CAA0190811.1 conserved exported hypothetical protein [Tenacibaculum maritimum]
MKKLLFIAMVAFGLTANAQEEKGGFEKQDLYISGTAGYSQVSVGGQDADDTVFTFSPSVGYFITDNIALELGVGFGSSKRNQGLGEVKTNSFDINLGGNYFFTPKKDFSFMVGAGLSYGKTSSKQGAVKGPDYNTFGFVIAPGVNYFISESFALRASVGALSYENGKADVSGAKSNSSFDFNLDFSDINFGLTYKF